MRHSLNAPTFTLIVLFSLFLLLNVGGCSSSGAGSQDLQTQMSGQWKRDQGDTVVIDLAKDAPSLTVDGHVYSAVIEKIDKMSNTVELKVATDGGENQKWFIHQVWSDNGSTFKLQLRRNGTTDVLSPVGQS
ncbi:hypothetical protein [uncultured Desulfosarcina sp.]|uniref:hypothetical protein n=1 Tax=uncultured Desulfosarcina sp. TaxID=218289 RepID=UPI0029C7399A|nr:hypothetical protein [uncultured Desulfosarcina sp.]